jgi:hypothetical protein
MKARIETVKVFFIQKCWLKKKENEVRSRVSWRRAAVGKSGARTNKEFNAGG